MKLLICTAFVSSLLLANAELLRNNWIHLRFTEDSMPAEFYICMEMKRWNLVAVNSLSGEGLFLLLFFFPQVSRKVCVL